MKKTVRSALFLAASSLMAACASKPPVFEPFHAESLNEQVNSALLVPKTKNLYVLFDASSSMSKGFDLPGYSAQPEADKFAVEKEILSRMNQTLPNIQINSAIRSFGFGSCMDWEHTKLVQPLQPHSKATFQSSLDSIPCSGGGTPMTAALDATFDDLNSASGKTALLILSDGHDESVTSPLKPLHRLISKYDGQLCVYSVWVGSHSNDEGHQLMKSLSEMADCGAAVDATAIASSSDMADFVKQVFFMKGEPKVDTCALDSDGDGLNDCQDQCPLTPQGADVDTVGCWAYHGVLFDFDKTAIRPEFDQMLDNAAKVMKMNPTLTISIEGHTDNIGPEAYNQNLSERRAQSVMDYLINDGISASRMEAHGYGSSQPIASNDTKEGRQANRRVVFKRTDK